MLAGGAAAEVLPSQQDACTPVAGEVQHEVLVHRTLRAILVRLTDVQVAPLVKQIRTEAGALDGLEKLLRNDLIGIDVGTIERADQAGVLGKGFHPLSPQAWTSSRTSMKWPVTAAAAAMAGLTRWVRPPAP